MELTNRFARADLKWEMVFAQTYKIFVLCLTASCGSDC